MLRRSSSDGALRDAIRLVRDEARVRQLHAEDLIIAFKQTWVSLPEVQQLRAGRERDDLLARVISMCIQEFYNGRGEGRSD